jgi:hypothetical protein
MKKLIHRIYKCIFLLILAIVLLRYGIEYYVERTDIIWIALCCTYLVGEKVLEDILRDD